MSSQRSGSFRERVRRLFRRSSRARDRGKRTVLVQDIDETPQIHLMEAQHQMSMALSPGGIHIHQRPLQGSNTACDAQVDSGNFNTPHASADHGHKCEDQGPKLSDGESHGSVKDPDQKLGSISTCCRPYNVHVSPLELFYHTYVAPYDQRATRQESVAGERKPFVRSSKRPSKDNTIGSIDSIDSIDSEAGLVEVGGDLSTDDDFVSSGDGGREFVAGAAKRLESAERRVKLDSPVAVAEISEAAGCLREAQSDASTEAMPRLSSCPAERDEIDVCGRVAATQARLGGDNDSDHVAVIVNDNLPCGEVDENSEGGSTVEADENAGIISPVANGGGASASTDVVTLSLSNKEMSSEFSSPYQIHTGIKMDAFIDSAKINVKRSRDKVRVSGKYSQVVIVQGQGQYKEQTPLQDDVKDADNQRKSEAVIEDLHDILGRKTAFNICGENIYISLGGKKTRIKSWRKENAAKSQPGPSQAVAGSPVEGKKGKRKKSKKSRKENTAKNIDARPDEVFFKTDLTDIPLHLDEDNSQEPSSDQNHEPHCNLEGLQTDKTPQLPIGEKSEENTASPTKTAAMLTQGQLTEVKLSESIEKICAISEGRKQEQRTSFCQDGKPGPAKQVDKEAQPENEAEGISKNRSRPQRGSHSEIEALDASAKLVQESLSNGGNVSDDSAGVLWEIHAPPQGDGCVERRATGCGDERTVEDGPQGYVRSSHTSSTGLFLVSSMSGEDDVRNSPVGAATAATNERPGTNGVNVDAAGGAADDDNDGRDEMVMRMVDDAGFIDVFALKQTWKTENKALKKLITMYRKRCRRTARLQQLIAQLRQETEEMKRMVKNMDKQTVALRDEANDMRNALSNVCDVTGLTRDTEAKTLEPACYRRYTNIRTTLDAVNLLAAIRSRIKALEELEVLVYRKQLMLHHVLPGATPDKGTTGPKRISRPTHKVQKQKKSVKPTTQKDSIVIEVVSPSPESGAATPSWSEDVTNTDSPVTTSAPFSVSVDGETPPLYLLDASEV